MSNLVCPECGGRLVYDPVTRYYTCTSCGLYATRDQLSALRAKKKDDASTSKDRSRHDEYLDWWSSGNKKKA